jgi:hypothetical protein
MDNTETTVMKRQDKREKPTRRLPKTHGLAAKIVTPREFVIRPHRLPDDIMEIWEIVSRPEAMAQQRDQAALGTNEIHHLLANLATGLWRMKRNMTKPATDEPLDEVRKAYRHLVSTWDLLVQEGIEIKDFTNEPFSAGMMLKVISHEPTNGLSRETIIETVKPTIFYRGEPIQIGEVIIGIPVG